MIYIKDILVSDKLGLDSLYVEFSINDTHDNLDNYIFDIYKSNHQTGAYTLLVSDIKDFSHRDMLVNLYDVSINYYYKIKVTDKLTSESILHDIYGEYKGRKPDLEAQAIVEIHTIYLKNIITEKLKLLKRKKIGQLCTCFDDVRRRSNPVSCEICYGTKYVGGYYSAYEIFVNYFNASNVSENFTVSDVGEIDSPLQLWTLNYPFIQINDILVSQDNTRYIVANCQPSHKNFYLIRQTLQIHRLPKSNIVYKVTV